MINDNMITGLAGALNGEAFTIPGAMSFSSDVVDISPTDTDIPNVLDSVSTTNSRSTTVVKFTGIRSGAAVISPTGDYINTIGLLTTAGGTLMAEATTANILHTNNFDLEIDWEITISRG